MIENALFELFLSPMLERIIPAMLVPVIPISVKTNSIDNESLLSNDEKVKNNKTPKVLYQRPANLFVSTFIGRTNIIDGKIEMDGNDAYLVLSKDYRCKLDTIRDDEKHNQTVKASIRPEELVINVDDSQGIKAIVDDAVFLGLNTHYFVHFEDGEKAEIIQESLIDSIIEKNSVVYLKVKTEKINVFVEDGSRNIIKGVVNDYDVYNKE